MISRSFLPLLGVAVSVVMTLCTHDVAGAASISGSVAVAGQSYNLSRTVVYLEGHPDLASDPPPDDRRPQIAQQGKAFIPNLLVVVQGTTVEFPNWDPFSHNVFSRSRGAQFDLGRYQQGQSKSYTFNSVGVVQVFCNIHPQMRAVLVVTPNRYFTLADAQGRFRLDELPPGRYELVVWHENAGEQRQTVEVPPAGLAGVSMSLAGVAREPAEPFVRLPRPTGVERGLGVKRERLGLPVVNETHPAPRSSPRR